MRVRGLLPGEGGSLGLEPDDVREAMQREVPAPSPDTAYFRNFPDCRVMINRLAAERFLRGDTRYGPPQPEEEEAEEEEEPVSWTGENPISPAPGERRPDAEEPTFELADEGEPVAARRCPYCGGGLPAGRKVNFCPPCGQPPPGGLQCPAGGAEGEVGWAYCAGCGRATGFE